MVDVVVVFCFCCCFVVVFFNCVGVCNNKRKPDLLTIPLKQFEIQKKRSLTMASSNHLPILQLRFVLVFFFVNSPSKFSIKF